MVVDVTGRCAIRHVERDFETQQTQLWHLSSAQTSAAQELQAELMDIRSALDLPQPKHDAMSTSSSEAHGVNGLSLAMACV